MPLPLLALKLVLFYVTDLQLHANFHYYRRKILLCYSILSNAYLQNSFRLTLLTSVSCGLIASLTRTMSPIS